MEVERNGGVEKMEFDNGLGWTTVESACCLEERTMNMVASWLFAGWPVCPHVVLVPVIHDVG